MILPWIFRPAHKELIEFLRDEIAGLKQERRILLDRLATLGLGGPLFSVAPEEDSVTENEDTSDPEQALVDQLMQLRRRPTQLADELTRRSRQDFRKRYGGPKVAWVPKEEKIEVALNEAEALGMKRATENS